ncbi:MAG: alpha-amylase family glycosyl hydrolase [Myxococcales bacterium]
MKKLASACLALVVATSCFDGAGLQPKITNHVEDWRDEVVYQLMTDRFANGDLGNDYNVDRASPGKYHGGDFAGIEAKIPYLKELGVTTLWISPVVKNVEEDAGFASYHGYWAQDLTAVNPHFGDMASLRHMVDAAHAAGLKVVLDIVTNHMGQLFFYDINGNGQADERAYTYGGFDGGKTVVVSEWDPDFDVRGIMGRTATGEYGPAPIRFLWMPEINRIPPMPEVFQNPTWYHRRGRVVDPAGWSDLEQVEKGDFPGGLKDLFTEKQEVRDALFEAYAKWIENADFDGFRIDTVKHVEHGFWQDFCPRMRKRAEELGKKNFLMFGEVFDGDDAKVGSYSFNDELDTLFNFAQKYTIENVFKGIAPTKALADNLAGRRVNFSNTPSKGIGLSAQQSIVNFLDNHDTPRFLYGGAKREQLHGALSYLFFEEGIPNVFYGTEQEYAGGNDPANREDLSKSGFSTETPTFQWIAKLAKVRKAYSPLRRGTMEFKYVTEHKGEEEDAGMLAFERADENFTALVVINAGSVHSARTSLGGQAMKTSFAAGTRLVDVMGSAAEAMVVGENGAVSVEAAPLQSLVLVPEEWVVVE